MEKIRRETVSILENALLQRGITKVYCSLRTESAKLPHSLSACVDCERCLYMYMYVECESGLLRDIRSVILTVTIFTKYLYMHVSSLNTD